MSAIVKKVGLTLVIFDLFVGVASAAVLHQSAGASCTSEPAAGWDYYCISSDGSRTLYDVSAGRITERADLTSYR